jgi:hypothetical protein
MWLQIAFWALIIMTPLSIGIMIGLAISHHNEIGL